MKRRDYIADYDMMCKGVDIKIHIKVRHDETLGLNYYIVFK